MKLCLKSVEYERCVCEMHGHIKNGPFVLINADSWTTIGFEKNLVVHKGSVIVVTFVVIK